MALILCIESATESCSIALSQDWDILIDNSLSEEFRHSAGLHKLIQTSCKEVDVGLESIDAVAVSDGPGSYTGLRVGASAAKGLCYALDKPLISVPTLKSLASEFEDYNDQYSIMPMIDARRMEVYTAVFNNKLEECQGVHSLVLDQRVMTDYVNDYGPLLICGNGASKWKEHFQPITELICRPTKCKASSLAKLAKIKYDRAEFEDLAYYRPFYFKSPNITKSKKKLLG